MENFGISVKSFIVDEAGQLLILRRRLNDPQSPGVWDIVGGRLEAGEEIDKGLERETREEAGIEIEIVAPLDVQQLVRGDGQKITMIIFLCRPLSKQVRLSLEHTEFEWAPISQCKEKLFPAYHQTVDRYGKFFAKEIDL